ncbi:MAG: adenylate/guanylate cyclase domain-containing protein [Leptospiraceae bacterium]|nr:adenylate/guanylate cyclase domain-containing protein [Leptospiraceae bacterium]
MWVNGTKLSQNGIVGKSEETSIPENRPQLIFFQNSQNNNYEVQIIGIIFAVLVLFTSAKIYSLPIQILLIINLLGGLYCIYRLVIAIINKAEGAILFFIGFAILIISFANDILYSYEIINTARLVPFGLFIFIFSQSILLSVKFANAFRKIERMSVSMQKFVPKDFLSLIGKESIEEVQFGEQVEKFMTVLFLDIRDFTKLSETMSPKENFDFINAMLKRLGPIIRNHNGFIDKYIGDGIMALFPKSPNDALNASIEMCVQLNQYNQTRVNDNFAPIKIGIGINTGRLILGTIGETERMEGTVISDAVNLASRIEGLNKNFGTSIILTETSLSYLDQVEKYQIRLLGNANIKGKIHTVKIFECFDHDSTMLKNKKIKYKSSFESAVQLYTDKKYKKSRTIFQKLKKLSLDDPAIEYYLGILSSIDQKKLF